MERKSDNKIQPECENCGRALYGRIDKRFCNDNCRNEFNRRKKLALAQKENDSLPEILRIIKNNYKILISFGPLEGDLMWHVERRKLKSMGFNFKYFTSSGKYLNDEFRYCFERGWCNSGEEFINIKDDPFQADTSR